MFAEIQAGKSLNDIATEQDLTLRQESQLNRQSFAVSPAIVTQAFKMILRDKNVKAILVNIFGGIMKCDTIADGIITAAKEVGIKVPLVVRLEGTNVDLGKSILEQSDLDITTASTMKEAAAAVIDLI